jgi:isoleucyl-tRNA synthetase
VITHGFVLDEEGRGMSKSLGNFIEPEEIISQHGAEILRLWVAMLNYKEDARFGSEILQRLVEAYRKIRNTWRFILGNLYDFAPDEEMVALEDMNTLDRWILEKCSRLGRKILQAFEDYEFHIVFHRLYNFFTVELSAFYLDVLKDSLYCSEKSSPIRKSAQTALFLLLKQSLVLMAPILPFTTEEAWEAMPDYTGKEESVHLELFPVFKGKWLDDGSFSEWEDLIAIREKVLKDLERAREEKLIGNSLQASVALDVPSSLKGLLKKHQKDLASLFIVSSVHLSSTDKEDLQVNVTKAGGEKCQRCWNYSSYVGKSSKYPLFCKRCEEVVSKIEA